MMIAAMRWFCTVTLLTLLIAPAETQPSQDSFAVLSTNVIPMNRDGVVLANHTVVIADSRIVTVAPSATATVPADMLQIDGRGKYLMPGLADMHVHLEYFEDPSILGAFTANGVTTVRNMDGRPYLLEWKRRIAARTLPGPRIYTAGPLLDGNPPVRPDNTVVTTAEEARAAVQAQLRDGYDFIKVYSGLSPEAYAAIVETARRLNADVSGHVPRAIPVDRALESRQRSIEHLSDFGSEIQGGAVPGWARRYLAAPIDSARLAGLTARLVKSGVWIVPTLVQPEREILRDDELTQRLASTELRVIPADGRQLWERRVRGAAERMDNDDWKLVAAGRAHRLQVVKAFHDAGVKLLAGTDTPNPFVVPGFSLHDELALLVEAGLPAAAALAAATREAGVYMRGDWGVIQEGAPADLLLLLKNPLDDISNTRLIEGVAVDGRWLNNDARHAMLRRLWVP
jgi:imidazolonepropionase-like amidohydrolase